MAMDLVGIGLKNQSKRYFSQIRYLLITIAYGNSGDDGMQLHEVA